MVTLGKNLGLKIVAEGIETQKQLEFLKRLNCDFGQGFLLCKPIPANNIKRLFVNSDSNHANITRND